jgi:hypothetical protein
MAVLAGGAILFLASCSQRIPRDSLRRMEPIQAASEVKEGPGAIRILAPVVTGATENNSWET